MSTTTRGKFTIVQIFNCHKIFTKGDPNLTFTSCPNRKSKFNIKQIISQQPQEVNSKFLHHFRLVSFCCLLSRSIVNNAFRLFVYSFQRGISVFGWLDVILEMISQILLKWYHLRHKHVWYNHHQRYTTYCDDLCFWRQPIHSKNSRVRFDPKKGLMGPHPFKGQTENVFLTRILGLSDLNSGSVWHLRCTEYNTPRVRAGL